MITIVAKARKTAEFPRQAVADKLHRGLQALPGGQPLEQAVQQAFVEYLALLYRWNQAYNLTAVRDPLDMVCVHIMDSLSVAPFVPAGRVLDVGTGAGLPGLVLAIALPDRRVDLIDANGKKTRFCQQVVNALGLSNVSVFHQRVEDFSPQQKYHAVLSRAYASLSDFLDSTDHVLRSDGVWLAMKGQGPSASVQDYRYPLDTRIEQLDVPGLDASRHLAVMRRAYANANAGAL